MKKNFSLILFISAIAINSISQTPSYLPTEALSAWWPFNGNTLDESMNNNDGFEVNVTLSTDRFGLENKCYHFDNSNEYILVHNHESLDLTSSFSISLWFYSENTTAFNSFISKSSCNNPYIPGYTCGLWDFYTSGNNSKLNFQAYPYMFDANPTLPSEDGLLSLNTWYHFVVTYDETSNMLTYHLNNELVESIELYFDIEQTNLDLIIGNHLDFIYGNCYNTYMIGKLDDIGIWSRVLNRDEIKDLFSADENNTTTNQNEKVTNNPKDLIDIFPNPTTDFVNIDFHDLNKFEGGKVKIMSMSGQIVYEENITQSKMTLSVVDRFSKGIYIVTTTDSGGNTLSNEKLIVQ